MSTTKNITAAPAEITLAGKPYLMYPLRDKDNIALDEFVRTQFVKTAILTENEWAVGIALKECIDLTWTTRPGNKFLDKIGGWARVLWQALRLEGEYYNVLEGATSIEIVASVATFRRINDLGEDGINPKKGQILDMIDEQSISEL